MRSAIAFAMLATLALTGCASLSEKECRGGDWYSIGLRDGAGGRTEDYVSQHAAACQEHGVAPDYERWLEGRERGLERFCTARNGYRIGEVGGTYQDVCFAGAEMEFRRGYELGLRMNRVQSRLDQIENEIRTIEGSLSARADELTDEERQRLNYRLRELEYERGYVRRDHDDLEWRGRSL
jgi:hypothetical protein